MTEEENTERELTTDSDTDSGSIVTTVVVVVT